MKRDNIKTTIFAVIIKASFRTPDKVISLTLVSVCMVDDRQEPHTSNYEPEFG